MKASIRRSRIRRLCLLNANDETENDPWDGDAKDKFNADTTARDTGFLGTIYLHR